MYDLLYLLFDSLLIPFLILAIPFHFRPVIIIDKVVVFIPADRQLINVLLGLLRHGTAKAILT
jgi:hypothetical protein